MNDDPKRTNIWEDNVGESDPPIEYKDLEELINFDGFSFDKWHTGERNILQPQLEYLGYTVLEWKMGEADSFGPLTRVCKTRDRVGNIVWFIYG